MDAGRIGETPGLETKGHNINGITHSVSVKIVLVPLSPRVPGAGTQGPR